MTRRAGGDDRLDEPPLQAGQLEVSTSLPSPTVPRPNSPARSPTTTIATSAPAAAPTAAAMPRAVGILTSQPGCVDQLGVGNSARSASSDARDLEAELDLGVVGEHVVGERVAPHQGLGGVGVRADHRDARAAPRAAGCRRWTAGRPTPRRARRASARCAGASRSIGWAALEGLVEQAEVLLLREHAQRRRGRRAASSMPPLRSRLERAARRTRRVVGSSTSMPARERERGRVARVVGDARASCAGTRTEK